MTLTTYSDYLLSRGFSRSDSYYELLSWQGTKYISAMHDAAKNPPVSWHWEWISNQYDAPRRSYPLAFDSPEEAYVHAELTNWGQP